MPDPKQTLGDIEAHELPGGEFVVCLERAITEDQYQHLIARLSAMLPGRAVVVLPYGVRMDPAPVLARIEAKLDALIAALAEEDAEPLPLTLDGQQLGAPREPGQPL